MSLEGGSTDVALNNAVISSNLQNVVRISQNYGTEAGVGGNVTMHKGQLSLTASIQDYDLAQWAIDQGITGSIEIRKVYYEAPPAILRYFDPYAGTGTGVQSLMDSFGFGNMSPGINFMLMPAYFDKKSRIYF